MRAKDITQNRTKPNKTQYERFLNSLYTPQEALRQGEHMKQAKMMLGWGRYGSALRKYDPIAFEIGYNEWKGNL